YSIFKNTQKRVSQKEGHNIVYNIIWEDFFAGKRNAKELFTGAGITHGYDQAAIRRYLRSQGARVAEINPENELGKNTRVKLRHIGSLLEHGWNVKLILKFGPSSYHAVIIDGLVVNAKTKAITAVRVYDPNVGRLIEV